MLYADTYSGILVTKTLAVDYQGFPSKIPLEIPYIIILYMTISGYNDVAYLFICKNI